MSAQKHRFPLRHEVTREAGREEAAWEEEPITRGEGGRGERRGATTPSINPLCNDDGHGLRRKEDAINDDGDGVRVLIWGIITATKWWGCYLTNNSNVNDILVMMVMMIRMISIILVITGEVLQSQTLLTERPKCYTFTNSDKNEQLWRDLNWLFSVKMKSFSTHWKPKYFFFSRVLIFLIGHTRCDPSFLLNAKPVKEYIS